jgi:phage shock protein PspC (stress-responsive transcriptional regulator)
MKETIKVNLNGQLFDLDNDAYDRLKKYLNSLGSKFGNNTSNAKEILEDIEARIAELLNSKLGTSRQVVTLADIEEIIGKLGTADEMDDAAEPSVSEKHSYEYAEQPAGSRKRMYREVDHKVIGGVCSGLGNYFNIDPIWMRLIFVGLFFLHLSGVLIYIILWIAIPAAVTTAQKLEAQGKAVNIGTISESVNREFSKVKSGMKNFSQTQEYRNAESALHEIIRVIGEILLVAVKVIGAIVGVSLVIALLFVILSLIFGGFSLASLGVFHHIHFPGFCDWQSLSLLAICLVVVICIPIIALFVKFVRWVFGLPGQNQIISVVGATIWVLALISLIVLLSNGHNQGLFRNHIKSTHTLNTPYSKSLYISLDSPETWDKKFEHYQVFDFDFFWDEDDDEFLNEPELSIQKSNDNSCHLELQKDFYHFEVGKVPDNFEEIANYRWKLTDTLLVLDKFYTSDEDELFRLPTMKLILYLPEGKTVQFSDDVTMILSNSDNHNNSIDLSSAANHKLKMTSRGLEILK